MWERDTRPPKSADNPDAGRALARERNEEIRKHRRLERQARRRRGGAHTQRQRISDEASEPVMNDEDIGPEIAPSSTYGEIHRLYAAAIPGARSVAAPAPAPAPVVIVPPLESNNGAASGGSPYRLVPLPATLLVGRTLVYRIGVLARRERPNGDDGLRVTILRYDHDRDEFAVRGKLSPPHGYELLRADQVLQALQTGLAHIAQDACTDAIKEADNA